MSWTRIGLFHESGSEFRPLLGLEPSKDGGIVVSPAYLPPLDWTYGVTQVPSGRYAGLPGSLVSPAVRTTVTPKLHYHRSGYVSINLSGSDLPRQGRRCLPLVNLRGAQIFTATFENLEAVEPRPFRRGDLFLVPHGSFPARVVVQGFVYAADQVPDLDRITPGPVGLVVNAQAENVVDLRHYGVDAALVVRLTSWSDGSGPEIGLAASLFGFDARAGMDGLSDAVGMWSHEWVRKIALLEPDRYPFARIVYPRSAGGLTLRERNLTGGLISSRRIERRDSSG